MKPKDWSLKIGSRKGTIRRPAAQSSATRSLQETKEPANLFQSLTICVRFEPEGILSQSAAKISWIHPSKCRMAILNVHPLNNGRSRKTFRPA